MFVKDNTIKSFRAFFINCLSKLYDINEINQLYNLTFLYYKGWDKISIKLNEGNLLSESELIHLNKITKRLKNSEPIQHIFGETNFYGLDFFVNKNVLIPRQETEELVDLIIKNNNNTPINLLDVGSGSGCIPITLAKKCKNINPFAIDVNNFALEIANKNAKKHNVNLKLYCVDILQLSDISNIIPENIDIIVSNPPYITNKEKEIMHKNVLNFEPHIALFVEDTTPLIFYEKITILAEKKLNTGGKLFFEINENFGKETLELVNKYNFKDAILIKDINGKDRIIHTTKC